VTAGRRLSRAAFGWPPGPIPTITDVATPNYVSGNVRAPCPDCDGTVTTFEMRSGGSTEYGSVSKPGELVVDGVTYQRTIYQLLRCASCGRGGVATIVDVGSVTEGTLIDFYPLPRTTAKLPDGVPDDVAAEYREAEKCASVAAWRGGSALLRSALEKTLAKNGYVKGVLRARIDEAAADGVITAARQRRAHDDVRSLGNDILHDDWRAVDATEYDAAHHYVLRILEDFYDHREEVEAVLKAKGRVPST
jgi:hypothetical protein